MRSFPRQRRAGPPAAARRPCWLLALLVPLAGSGWAQPSADRTVYLASDRDWAAFLEAVPLALRFDEQATAHLHPILALPDPDPWPLHVELHLRGAELVYHAQGPEKDGLPAVLETREELRLRVPLPDCTQAVTLARARGLERVRAALEPPGGGEPVPLQPGTVLEHPAGGEWHLAVRVTPGAKARGRVELDLEVKGWDLEVVRRFLRAYRPRRVLVAGELPAPVRQALAAEWELADLDPVEAAREHTGGRVLVSTSYRSALLAAHSAGLDSAAHLVHRGTVADTAARLAALQAQEITVVGDAGSRAATDLARSLRRRRELRQAQVRAVTADEAEQELCQRHYLSDVVVASPRDRDLPPGQAYPRASLAAPVYGVWRRVGILLLEEGDRERYASSGSLASISFGLPARDRAYLLADVAAAREALRAGIARLDLSSRPYVTLLGGDDCIPGLYRSADGEAVRTADSTLYADLDGDGKLEAGVGRIPGNTDEITVYLARLLCREELEDRVRHEARRAVVVAAEGPGRRIAARLEAVGRFQGSVLSPEDWSGPLAREIGEARLLLVQDEGFPQGGWGWAGYDLQDHPLHPDVSYCLVASGAASLLDDRQASLLHPGGSPLPAGLLLLREGALGVLGTAGEENPDPLGAVELAAGTMSLGEAILWCENRRRPGPASRGLQLWGDPHLRLSLPPVGSYLDLARGAGDFLLAQAQRSEEGWNLTGEDVADSAYGQSGAGAAIFLLHLYEATGEARYLEGARRAADWVEHATAQDPDRVPGLFVGDSGKGLLYLELARVTGEKEHLTRADALVRHYAAGWTHKKSGQPYWTTDLYMGAAGHLLFLLEMHRVRPEEPLYLKEARRAGDWLVSLAAPAGQDACTWSWEPWATGPGFHYTGMAHGTAGIAYALARLHRATGEKRYLAYARAGTRAVMDRAMPLGEGYRWYSKYTPRPAQIKYQWCHGPPGILLLFLEMYDVTGEEVYRTWAEKTAITAVNPGKFYRLDMSLCHGPPGNADILLDAYLVLGDEWYLERARDHAELIRQQGFDTGKGLDWYHCNRTYMNGVAGVGHFFLRMAQPGRFPPALIAR